MKRISLAGPGHLILKTSHIFAHNLGGKAHFNWRWVISRALLVQNSSAHRTLEASRVRPPSKAQACFRAHWPLCAGSGFPG